MSGLSTIFREGGNDSPFSIRRVSASYLFSSSTALGIVGTVFELPWQAIVALVGIPIFAGVLLLLFTTWADIKAIIESAKASRV